MSASAKSTETKKRFAITIDDKNYIVSYSEHYMKPGDVIVETIPEKKDLQKLQCYQYIDGKYILDSAKWADIKAERVKKAAEQASENAKNAIKENVFKLKKTLAATDYKIIKCFECSLLNIDLPYDIETLHAERQALRDQINNVDSTL